MLDYERLHRIIRESGFTLGEIAIACGINRQNLYKKLNGEREFKITEYEKLCACLDISPSTLLVSETEL
jgi:transcriptional regulator with XRE-family HTH domain